MLKIDRFEKGWTAREWMTQRQYGGVDNRPGGGRRMTRVEIGHAKEKFTDYEGGEEWEQEE